jgi:hypothetical protein
MRSFDSPDRSRIRSPRTTERRRSFEREGDFSSHPPYGVGTPLRDLPLESRTRASPVTPRGMRRASIGSPVLSENSRERILSFDGDEVVDRPVHVAGRKFADGGTGSKPEIAYHDVVTGHGDRGPCEDPTSP